MNKGSSLTLSDVEREQKIESTIASTFMWMWVVLLLSFWIAYALSLWIVEVPFSSTYYWISWIGWLGIIFLMNMKWRSMSYTTLALLLLLFWLLEGYWLSWVFRAYSLGSIYNVFMSSAVLFFVLAFAWYHVKIDIARVGPVLFWSMIALIISLLLNAFVLQSGPLDMWLSVLWIVIFSWFIIYDMNILRQQALGDDRRVELLMALWLFINFVNIFLFLLRLTWGSQD